VGAQLAKGEVTNECVTAVQGGGAVVARGGGVRYRLKRPAMGWHRCGSARIVWGERSVAKPRSSQGCLEA